MATAPGIIVEETTSAGASVTGASVSSTAVFVGVCQRGPVGQAVLLRGDLPTEFARVFGDPVEGETIWYQVRDAARNGAEACYVLRVAQLIEGEGAPAPASLVVPSGDVGVAAQAIATPVRNLDGTLNLALLVSPTTIDAEENIQLNTGISHNFDLEASRAVSSFFEISDTDDTDFSTGSASFSVSFNDGPFELISLEGAVFASKVAILNALNTLTQGGTWLNEAGDEIRLVSNRLGTSSKIVITGVATQITSKLGISAGTFNGSGMVSNLAAVTVTELRNLILAATTGRVDVQDLGATLRFFATTLPPEDSSLDVDALSPTIALGLGLPLGLNSGWLTGSVDALRLTAGYRGFPSPGLWGNDLFAVLTPTPRFESLSAGADLFSDGEEGADFVTLRRSRGLSPESVLVLSDGLTSERYVVRAVRTVGAGQFVVELTSPLSKLYPAASSTASSEEYRLEVSLGGSLVETWANLSMNPNAARYAVGVLNSSSAGSRFVVATDLTPGDAKVSSIFAGSFTGGSPEAENLTAADFVGNESDQSGFFALDNIQDAEYLVVCPSEPGGAAPADPDVMIAAIDYCERRKTMTALLTASPDANEQDLLSLVNGDLARDTRHFALYANWGFTDDPLGRGSRRTRLTPPLGVAAGVSARVTRIPGAQGGGFAGAPAGIGVFGQARGWSRLNKSFTDAEHGRLNAAGINVLRVIRDERQVPQIAIQGVRTGTSDDRFDQLVKSRVVHHVIRSSTRLLQPEHFRNNDVVTRNRVRSRLATFLRELWVDRQLAGATTEDAYFVICDETNNGPEVLAAKQLRVRVGIAVQTAAEFIVLELETAAGGTVSASVVE
jgi:hypothetical protein